MRYIGGSNFAGWQIADAAWIAETKHLEHFVSAQNRYSLLDRRLEQEVVPACERFGLGVLPFFPLEYGLLTGKYRRGEGAPEGSRAALDPDRAGWLASADWDRIEALEEHFPYVSQRSIEGMPFPVGGVVLVDPGAGQRRGVGEHRVDTPIGASHDEGVACEGLHDV